MKYNGRLAITAFICGLGSIFLSSLISILISRLGTSSIAAYSVANSVINVLQRLIIIPLIIAFFRQSRALNYVALGMEGLMILLMLVIPGPLMTVFSAGSDIIGYGVQYLRVTAVILFVLTGLCVLLSFVIRRRRMMTCLIAAGAATLMSVLLVWLTMYSFHMGMAGAAFANLTQPFHYLLPLLMLNPDRDGAPRAPRAKKIPRTEP